jgi:hypothetical protein
MTTKKNQTTKAAIKPKTSLYDDKLTQGMLMPSLQATLTINTWQPQMDLNPLFKELSSQIDNVNNGNMKSAEAMLLVQA